jgi:hypothetical protein
MPEYKEDAKVPYVSREDFPADQIGIYDHILQTRKLDYIPELFARMASSPGAMEAVASVGEHVRFNSVLDEVLREMVICRRFAARRLPRTCRPRPDRRSSLRGSRRPTVMWMTRYSRKSAMRSAIRGWSI